VVPHTSFGTILHAGASCPIGVTFTPSTTGTCTGTLTGTSKSLGGAISLTLAGNGVEYAPTFNRTTRVFSSQVVGTESDHLPTVADRTFMQRFPAQLFAEIAVVGFVLRRDDTG